MEKIYVESVYAKRVYAIRGAIDVKENTETAILQATEAVLRDIVNKNGLEEEDIISAIFTVTPDLTAAFPAAAARKLGWTNTALICAKEIPVPGAMKKVVRVLIHAYMENKPVHIYLGRTWELRPDL